ncbi:uncharacterized protein BDR25DRAFT_243020 [Lindgomyces ingoldianus]|uniref:Uncharacterized protein n=1 Tax=Lindgomyces ingoldianus TaxID=673940 RepID=A0ACB6QDS7_9PLEO|nr:uncharacterized protein BDR25DRAFT_243020 [Lindgomyces ingoldianus]KAF2464300.1 hypothetical protein BDR25DRAFT_243020 [Lindgomyces ingoldianus]
MTSSTANRTKKRNDIVHLRQSIQFPNALTIGLISQISQGAVINEAFYANFLSYFTSDGEGKDIQNRMTWLHQLPLLSTDGTNVALALALRATASAFCAVDTANIAVVQEACKLYGQALNAHARLLRSKPKEVTVHMVSTSVMLSIFEAMQATTADGYREHIHGAAKMIEVTGPGQCLHGVLCQLFFHVRTQMAFIYLTTHKSQAISVKKILTETLSYHRFPMFQRLMSHIAVLAEIYVNKTSPGSQQQLIDLSVYSSVKTEIEALWHEYQSQASEKNQNLFWTEAGKTYYRDGFTALSVAYFCAARILFTILAPRLASSYIDFTDHYGRILDCARFLRTKKIGCAYMRMATPLFLVSLHSSSPTQRKAAISIFEDWKKGSMAGISALALETIHKRQANNLGDIRVAELAVSDPVRNDPLNSFELEDWVGHV